MFKLNKKITLNMGVRDSLFHLLSKNVFVDEVESEQRRYYMSNYSLVTTLSYNNCFVTLENNRTVPMNKHIHIMFILSNETNGPL